VTTPLRLLSRNRNYRCTWTGQVVSEIGDNFNTIAVFSLALAHQQSGLILSGVMLSRAIPAVLAGPLAGVVLDRFDRRLVMIWSDLVRAVVAGAFVATVHRPTPVLLYALSALLMFASPFFTSGRSAILPSITDPDDLHAANTLTQTTQWTTLTVGALTGGVAVARLGFEWAFLVNSLSFLLSAWCVYRIRVAPSSVTARSRSLTEADVARPWREYVEGLRYMRSEPLVMAIALVGVGWATGGGAAQILFGLFGETVFKRGPAGIGALWSCAGIGLLVGGIVAYQLGPRLSFRAYTWAIPICYLVHGSAYVVFSQMESFPFALLFIGISRAAVAVSSVVNFSHLLRTVPDDFRGRVFATLESMVWFTMMVSMALAGLASESYSPRVIGAWSGVLSASTALFWAWANVAGRLREPVERDVGEVEVHGEATISA
jgi:predicted MFS family arabinose efflux permease